MQEIANGTFNYAQLSEIMPMIYKRFTEKAAEEWRQIYKALQLLEFLIKNGSERVIDDARSHLSLLKMLRQFHYIDSNGKDQGINVRNRAKELAELLGDVERIRTERKKARTTRNKYSGVEGGVGAGSASRYGGFSSESAAAGRGYGGFSGGVYGDGGGFGGEGGDDYSSTQNRRDRFEEYDEYDDGSASAAKRTTTAAPKRTAAKAEPAKAKEPEVDLFDFGDDDVAAPASTSASNGKTAAATDDFGDFAGGDDDFDDFQSATTPAATTTSRPAPSQPAAVQPLAPPPQTSAMGTFSPPAASGSVNYSAFNAPPVQTVTSPTAAPLQPKPTGYQAAQPNYFGSISAGGSGASTPALQHQRAASGVMSSSTSTPGGATSKPASGADPFASLLSGASSKKATGQKGPSMGDLAKQKANAGLWGAPTAASQPQGGSHSGDLI